MDLNECFKKNLIKQTKIDKNLITSLIEMSHIKQKTVDTAQINSFNISAYVSLAYDSLREILDAICILNGYKVLSHICIIELLKQLLKRFDYLKINRFRQIRNNINYYGEKIDFKQGKEIINKIFLIKNSLIKKYLKSSLNTGNLYKIQ